jgi:hypothetical protein
MLICELNSQPKIMIEVLNTHRLFKFKPTLKSALDLFKGEENDSSYYNK